MKRFAFVLVLVLAVSLALSGCVSISKYTPPAADEEKPVLQGKIGKQQPKVKVEVELLEKPDFSRFSAPKTPDSELTGNRGNFAGGVSSSQGNYQPGSAPVQEQPKVWWSEMPEEAAEQKEIVMKEYKVKKGQTLADISKDVYGTTKKWRKIYEANKAKIKDPDKIYSGQILDIEVSESKRLK